MLAIGTVLQDRYSIVGSLGRGGMGSVYEARDTRTGASFALKETLSETPSIRAAFEHEARLLGKLEHEAFPRVTDYFSENDKLYLVMELVRGDDLAVILRRRTEPFALTEVLCWAGELLEALEVLHAYPVIHRDIKPANLKLKPRRRIKLLDFGIAKGVVNRTDGPITPLPTQSATLEYAPIEQILRVPQFYLMLIVNYAGEVERVIQDSTDARSDLYSLGATLYHLLTLRLPPNAPTRALAAWSGKPDLLEPPENFNPALPPAISRILLRAMALEREARYPAAAAMREALEDYRQAEARRAREAERQRYEAERQRLAAEAAAQRQEAAAQRQEAETHRQAALKAQREAATAQEQLRRMTAEREVAAQKAAELQRQAEQAAERQRQADVQRRAELLREAEQEAARQREAEQEAARQRQAEQEAARQRQAEQETARQRQRQTEQETARQAERQRVQMHEEALALAATLSDEAAQESAEPPRDKTPPVTLEFASHSPTVIVPMDSTPSAQKAASVPPAPLSVASAVMANGLRSEVQPLPQPPATPRRPRLSPILAIPLLVAIVGAGGYGLVKSGVLLGANSNTGVSIEDSNGFNQNSLPAVKAVPTPVSSPTPPPIIANQPDPPPVKKSEPKITVKPVAPQTRRPPQPDPTPRRSVQPSNPKKEETLEDLIRASKRKRHKGN